MKKTFKFISLAVCIIVAMSVFLACNGLKYSSKELEKGIVGQEYSASVATADGKGTITYLLKESSQLPEGLTLNNAGDITGIPTEKGEKTFTIVAKTDKKDKEAIFKINVDKGSIEYVGSDVKVAVGKESDTKVSTATNAVDIEYKIKAGSLPQGLSLDKNGTITGNPTTLGEEKTVIVTASAKDCDSKDATFKVKVTLPWVEYSGNTLALGRVGEYYVSLINTASGASDITYLLKEGTRLPDGLSLESDGIIVGKVNERVVRHNFTVVASATNFEPTEAEFEITTRKAQEGIVPSGIIKYQGGTLAEGFLGSKYLVLPTDSSTVATAKNTNRQAVNYVIDTATPLPNGLKLYPDGTIMGIANAVADTTVNVIAQSQGCEDVSAPFILSIKEQKLDYKTSRTIDGAVVGDVYNFSVADAKAVGDETAVITYSLATGSKMPEGLSVTSDGIITGTPTKSGLQQNFKITAKADGYSAVTTSVYMDIIDAVTVITNGKMEAEYTYLIGKTGAGISGAATGKGLVQDGSELGASNGRFIGFTHGVDITVEFEFTSDKAVSGVELKLSLGSELGAIKIEKSKFGILVNDVEIDYTPMTLLAGETGKYGNFSESTVSTSVTLKEGVNKIVLKVKANDYKNNQTGGPGIDSIQLITDATLSWRPCLYNLY